MPPPELPAEAAPESTMAPTSGQHSKSLSIGQTRFRVGLGLLALACAAPWVHFRLIEDHLEGFRPGGGLMDIAFLFLRCLGRLSLFFPVLFAAVCLLSFFPVEEGWRVVRKFPMLSWAALTCFTIGYLCYSLFINHMLISWHYDEVDTEAIDKHTRALAPYLEQARESYPAARSRFLAGLPPGFLFFVHADLQYSTGIHEICFIKVDRLSLNEASGVLQSDPTWPEFQRGQFVTVRESAVRDWVILHPDGVEEGNFTGKFLDSYNHPPRPLAAP